MKPQSQKNKTLKLQRRLKMATENYSVSLLTTKKNKNKIPPQYIVLV